MEHYLQAIVIVLSLINPIVAVSIFLRIEAGRPRGARLVDATKAAFAVLAILEGAALVGARLLDLFGVSLDAFSVAGGGVLAWMGFVMLSSRAAPDGPDSDTETSGKPSLAFLILFAASPGTITGVITLSVAHSGTDVPLTAMVAVAAAVSVMWALLALGTRFGSGSHKEGIVQDLSTRFMGLIIIAMGVQFALTGFKSFMAAAG
jgi:multiple antibiotic resistance protein